WEKTGVPGDVGLTHFNSSTISGSALWMMSRTFASVFPRQSPSCLIFSSINAEADSTGTFLFIFIFSQLIHVQLQRTYFSCARLKLRPPPSRSLFRFDGKGWSLRTGHLPSSTGVPPSPLIF